MWVFKGTSFVRFALLRKLFGGENSSRLIAFDVLVILTQKQSSKDRLRGHFGLKMLAANQLALNNYRII